MAAMAFVELVPGEWVQTLYTIIASGNIQSIYLQLLESILEAPRKCDQNITKRTKSIKRHLQMCDPIFALLFITFIEYSTINMTKQNKYGTAHRLCYENQTDKRQENTISKFTQTEEHKRDKKFHARCSP
jgi:hypothetical protein